MINMNPKGPVAEDPDLQETLEGELLILALLRNECQEREGG